MAKQWGYGPPDAFMATVVKTLSASLVAAVISSSAKVLVLVAAIFKAKHPDLHFSR